MTATHHVTTFGGVSFIFVSPFNNYDDRGPTFGPGEAGSDNLQNEPSHTRQQGNCLQLIYHSTINTPRVHPPAGEYSPPSLGGGKKIELRIQMNKPAVYGIGNALMAVQNADVDASGQQLT
jgi:hypothetical protein